MRPAAMRRLGGLVVCLALVGSVAVTPALATSITVNSLVDTTAEDGLCTLREAITAANTDTGSGVSLGECAVGSGADAITFGVAGTIALTSPLPAISSDVSIDGAGAITISGASVYQVINIAATGTATLAGLNVTDGSSVEGGGIFSAGSLTVTNSTISGNRASFQGGGILNTGSLTVTNSTISGNTADFGGGIYNTGTLAVTDSTISRNTGSFAGGGILNTGTLAVTNSTITGNFATLAGGGILNAGTLAVTNSTISGNTASEQGGGIANGGTVTVTNSTISANSAGGGGGLRASGTDTLVNAIIAGNAAPMGADVDGVAETITTSVIGVPAGMTLGDILDPGGLADNGGPTQTIALALVAGNPAIDTGTGAVCATAPVNGVDQRGMPRPAACDIGAYEAQSPTTAPTLAPTASPTPMQTTSPSLLPNTAMGGGTSAKPPLPLTLGLLGLGFVALGLTFRRDRRPPRSTDEAGPPT